jgi:tripartite-type tricarboxylate transporter receptor subunit TctC
MILILAVIASVAASSAGAFAAEWPSKPVRVVVPFAAGGAADTIGRLHADALTAAFGKQFYVENRVGGGGLVGTEAVARAEPDGLTLMVSGIPTHVLGPAMNKNVGFDPMRDFTHIAYFGGTPNVLVAHPSLGVTTYRDFLALARATDGIEYVSAGFGTMGNWIAEFLAAKEKIKLVHVAYKGGAQADSIWWPVTSRSAC